ncbi:MAG: alpha/beta hydrolase [Patescibacteria group bacterium]
MKNIVLEHPEKLEKKFLETDDGFKIYYDKYYSTNTKQILILLHGASGDTSAWHMMRDLLYKEGYSTLAIDLRGHGFSSRSNDIEFYHVDKIIKDIKQIIQKEDIKKYTLVGHCYGANIALKMASENPAGLASLVVINTSYKTGATNLYMALGPIRTGWMWLVKHTPTIGKPGQTNFSKFIGTGDLHPGRILTTVWKNTVKSYFMTFDTVLSLDTVKDVPQISCPVYIIGGAKDTFFQPETLYNLQKKMKNAQVHIMPKANHITVLNVPGELTHLVIDFLRNTR